MEFFKLLIIIFIPALVGIFLVKQIFWRVNKVSLSAKGLIELNSGSHLWMQPIFWLSVALPFFYSITSGLFVWIKYPLEISSCGFEYFIEISKLPLMFAALSIPLGALVARAHSTAQAATQIKEHERKNNFELFYKHQEVFFNYLRNETVIPSSFTITENKKSFSHLTLLYEELFPQNSPLTGITLQCNQNVLLEIKNKFLDAHHHLEVLAKSQHTNQTAYEYSRLTSSLISIMDALCLSEIYLNWKSTGAFTTRILHENVGVTEYPNAYYPFPLAEWYKYLMFCHQVFGLVCKFCHAESSVHSLATTDKWQLELAETQNNFLIDFRRSASEAF